MIDIKAMEAEVSAAVGDLSGADTKHLAAIRKLASQHLGSDAAASLWLLTPGAGGLTGTPADAIRQGQAEQLLLLLQAQWGPNPPYA